MRNLALELAVSFHNHPDATSTDVVETATKFLDFLTEDQIEHATEDRPAPKPTRRKAADKPDDSATKDKQSLEPATGAETSTQEDQKPASEPVSTISRDEMLAEATLYTQGPAGADGLGAILTELGYAKFSDVPAERYADFMAKIKAPKNPLE